MPRTVIIWYLFAYVLLGFVALNNSLHVPDSYAGLAFAVPMIGIPITLAVTVWGIVTNLNQKRWGIMLGYVVAGAGLYGLLRAIVS